MEPPSCLTTTTTTTKTHGALTGELQAELPEKTKRDEAGPSGI